MRKVFASVVLIISFRFVAFGQYWQKPLSTSYASLEAYSHSPTGIFSVAGNQACLAQLQHPAIGVFSERKFMMAELGRYIVVGGLPTVSGSFGLKGSYYGFSEHNQSGIGLAYARHLGKKLDIGAQFNYSVVKVAGYGNTSAISFEAGAIVHLTEKFTTGVHVSNPVARIQDKINPSSYTMGLGFDASPQFFVGMNIFKEEDQPVNVSVGLQYKFLPEVLARIGIDTGSSTGWMGIGFSWRSFRLDVLSAYHQQLGISPGLLLQFSIEKGEQ